MRAVLRKQLDNAQEIDGHFVPATDRNALPPITFRDIARFAWPKKTEFVLSELTGYDARTCRRWMAGQNTPPADADAVVWQEIYRRYHLSFK